MSQMVQLAATGDVVTRTARLHSVTVDHSAAATVTVRAGGSGGTIIQAFRLGAAGTAFWRAGDPQGVVCPGGIHVTLSAGTASVEYG